MSELELSEAINKTCPWSGKPISADSLTLYKGKVVGFCNHGCKDKFEKAVTQFEELLTED
jgi:YHS domain-containing protein